MAPIWIVISWCDCAFHWIETVNYLLRTSRDHSFTRQWLVAFCSVKLRLIVVPGDNTVHDRRWSKSHRVQLHEATFEWGCGDGCQQKNQKLAKKSHRRMSIQNVSCRQLSQMLFGDTPHWGFSVNYCDLQVALNQISILESWASSPIVDVEGLVLSHFPTPSCLTQVVLSLLYGIKIYDIIILFHYCATLILTTPK